ncbi:S8 family serine peptidase [candidate division KSB1 bacterium]|nr:S8 family serine peptidase [candidate division KSB1 bacterium]
MIDRKYLPIGTTLQTHIASMKGMKQFQSDEVDVFTIDQVVKSKVYVYIKLQPAAQISQIESLASRVTDVDTKNSLVVAWVEVDKLEKIASLDAVKSIRTVMPPIVRTGSVTTEGDGIHKTSDVRTTYSQSGSGIKVGIISDGVDTRSAAQATSDLPADDSGLTILSNAIGGDEGTAMLEIVHDMVPAADLYFHDLGGNFVAFNSAISDLVSAGCDVICDDVGWLTQPFYEDGTVASHVASVLSANDIIYVSAAGNAGTSHYQGDYTSLQETPLHTFSGDENSPYLYLDMEIGESVIIVLQWNDAFGSSGNDYNLFLFEATGETVVAQSVVVQDGNDDPLEVISYTAATTDDYPIVVQKTSGSTKNLEVYIYPNGCSAYSNNISPVDAIFGHPAVVGAVAVGAVRVTTPTTIESFSSQGPCTITYPASVSRSKPDIVGTDGGVITGAGGFGQLVVSDWRFYGTSASAPHISAVCAQLWAQLPGDAGDDIRDRILTTSVDLGTAGFDNVFGYGRADALAAFDTYTEPEIDVQRPASTSITDTGTDNVGSQTVGTVNLTYTIDNTAGTAPLSVTGVTASSYVNSSGFAVVTSLPLNVAAGGTGTLNVSFDVDAAGAFSLAIDIASNDADEDPYDITIEGTGVLNHVYAKIKVWLQGSYQAGGSMTTTLKTNGYIPTTSPYSDGRTVSTVPAGVTDWVFVELRTSATGSAVAQRSFFVKSNGEIVDEDGSTTDLQISGVADDDYFIVVRHRNHLAVMSTAAQALDTSPTSQYNFTTALTQYYGADADRAKEVETGVWGLNAGDGNESGIVTISDANLAITNRDDVGYHISDYNLSGIVTISDANLAIANRDANTNVN